MGCRRALTTMFAKPTPIDDEMDLFLGLARTA
jgi:hypothetical protein